MGGATSSPAPRHRLIKRKCQGLVLGYADLKAIDAVVDRCLHRLRRGARRRQSHRKRDDRTPNTAAISLAHDRVRTPEVFGVTTDIVSAKTPRQTANSALNRAIGVASSVPRPTRDR